MKLLRYKSAAGEQFGFLLNDRVYSFLECAPAQEHLLRSLHSYVLNLPGSRIAAEKIVASMGEKSGGEMLKSVKLLPLFSPAPALIDFGLTPAHMLKSAEQLITHELSGIKRYIALKMIKKRVKKVMSSSNYAYYKGNHNAISGEGDTITWPSYTAYLDIEPELALVYGTSAEPLAGYCILNDLSARDVQVPELNELSLTRSKDFDNGLGAILVTPDEIEDPLKIAVTVQIGDRERWVGDTSDYLITPHEVLTYLESIFTPASGTIIGLGTIPGCCGLERNCWVKPGESIQIAFEGLGTLTQHVPEHISLPSKGRWAHRADL